jgi:hypothetical protein
MTSLVPQSFIPGYRLQSGTDLNEALANPQWSTTMSLEATTGGTADTSVKIVNTITNITSATAGAGVTVPRSAIGKYLHIINSSANTVIIFAESDATINGVASYNLPAGDSISLYGTGTNAWQVDVSAGGGSGNVTPLEYGAIGNGVADDTAAVQAAFNDSTSVEIPDGYVFRITQPISVPAGRYIFSNGNGEIKIDQTAVIGGVSQSAYINGLRLNSNCTINGVVFRGTNVMCLTSFPSTLQAGVAIQTHIETNNVTIKNCKFYGFRSFGGAIIQIVRCNNVKILHNYFDETNWYASDINATIWAGDCIYDGNISYSNSDLFIGISDTEGDISASILYPRGANHIITNNVHIKLRWKQPWNPSVGGRASFNGTISGTTLTISSGLVGTVTVGQQVYVGGVTQRAIIMSGSGTTWTLSRAPGNQLTPVSMTAEIGLGRHGFYAHYARGKSYSIIKGNVIGNVCRHGAYLRGSTGSAVDQLGPDTVTENIFAYCGSGQLSEAGQSDNYASGVRLETTLPSLVSNNYLYKTGYFPDGTLGVVSNAADIECVRGTNDTIITYNRCIGAQGGAISLYTSIGVSYIYNVNITGNIIQTSKIGISLSVAVNTNYIADIKILQNHITLTSATFAGSVSTAPRAIGISYDQSLALPQTEKYSLLIQGNTVVGTGKQASFTGSINGYVLTASAITGDINVGQIVAGSGAVADTTIVSPAAEFIGVISGTTLTVSEMISGTIVFNGSAIIRGVGITPGTTITGSVTGAGGVGTYTVNTSHSPDTLATKITISNIWNISYSGTTPPVSGAMTSASNGYGIGLGFASDTDFPFTGTCLTSDNILRGLNVGIASYRFAADVYPPVGHRILGTKVIWQRNRLVNCDQAFRISKSSGNDLSIINDDNIYDSCTNTGISVTFAPGSLYNVPSQLGTQIGQDASGNMLVQFNSFSYPAATKQYYVGDKIMATAPTAGGNIGWVCVTAGTPGTWQRFGDIILSGSVTYDPPSLADGDGVTTTVTVTGAALGDYVTGVSFSLNLQGITVTAWVSAANTVSVRFQNETGGTLDLASGTLRANVMKQ